MKLNPYEALEALETLLSYRKAGVGRSPVLIDRHIEAAIAALKETLPVIAAATDCLDDLARYAGKSGPGPDRRLATLRETLGLDHGGR